MKMSPKFGILSSKLSATVSKFTVNKKRRTAVHFRHLAEFPNRKCWCVLVTSEF